MDDRRREARRRRILESAEDRLARITKAQSAGFSTDNVSDAGSRPRRPTAGSSANSSPAPSFADPPTPTLDAQRSSAPATPIAELPPPAITHSPQLERATPHLRRPYSSSRFAFGGSDTDSIGGCSPLGAPSVTASILSDYPAPPLTATNAQESTSYQSHLLDDFTERLAALEQSSSPGPALPLPPGLMAFESLQEKRVSNVGRTFAALAFGIGVLLIYFTSESTDWADRVDRLYDLGNDTVVHGGFSSYLPVWLLFVVMEVVFTATDNRYVGKDTMVILTGVFNDLAVALFVVGVAVGLEPLMRPKE
ncbi:hypothetical protein BJ742DRAFT_873263 [Cladochytrium replicatum]|nr:hypothetical protein BJ742DRAFT_873263 [Cladochytrium replicatum]